MIEKHTITQTKITMSLSNPHEDDKQGCRRSFTLKCKCELITKLKAAMHFMLHWTKLSSNLALTANTLVDGKSSWTMCPTAPTTTRGKCIQVTLVYWCLCMIFLLGTFWALWERNSSNDANCVQKGIWFVSNFSYQIRWCKVFNYV